MAGPRQAYLRVRRRAVEEPLKANGFAPVGTVRGQPATWLHTPSDEVCWVVDVQTSRYPAEAATSFTVNWGVGLPLDTKAVGGEAPHLLSGLLVGRLNNVAREDRLRDWWCDIRPDMDEDAAIAEVRQRMERDLFPFLASFATAAPVLAAAERALLDGERRSLMMGFPGALPITVAGLLRLGESERAHLLLRHMSRRREVPYLAEAVALMDR